MKTRFVGSPWWTTVAVLLPTLFGLIIAILWIALREAPIQTLLCSSAVALIGAIFIGIAEWQLIRRGDLFSVSFSHMPLAMRRFWRWGWILLAVGIAITVLAMGAVASTYTPISCVGSGTCNAYVFS